MELPIALKKAYRDLVPTKIRNSEVVMRLKSRVLPHNMMYDTDYYANEVEPAAIVSAKAIAASIVKEFAPNRVVDIGCGTGALLATLRDCGCEVFGLEYSDAALKFCQSRKLNVRKFDLESDDLAAEGKFDVAVSMEVAEHLPEKSADRYLDIIVGMARNVVFTAAQPHQIGNDHVNLQPQEYWIQKYRNRGFAYDQKRSQRWRSDWEKSGGVEEFYHRNLMLFRQVPA